MRHRFYRDQKGTTGVIVALSALPVVMMVGAAIDYGYAGKQRALLQSAVDAGTLAASEATLASAQTVGESFLRAGIARSGLEVKSSSFVMDVDGTVSGSAVVSFKPAFLGVLGVNKIELRSDSSAVAPAATPTKVRFQLTNYSGWYYKQVDLYVTPAAGVADKKLASYFYQPDNFSTATGTASAAFADATGTMVAGPTNTQVDLGQNYTNVYLTMTVYSDGCPAGQTNAKGKTFGSGSGFYCVPENTYVKSYTKGSNVACPSWVNSNASSGLQNSGETYVYFSSKNGGTCSGVTNLQMNKKTTQPYVFTTNGSDPNSATYASNLFIGKTDPGYVAQPLPQNKSPTVFDILPCPMTLVHKWEDTYWSTGWGSFPTGKWDPTKAPVAGTSWTQQDITFQVTTSVCAPNSNFVNVTTATTPLAKAKKGRLKS